MWVKGLFRISGRCGSSYCPPYPEDTAAGFLLLGFLLRRVTTTVYLKALSPLEQCY